MLFFFFFNIAIHFKVSTLNDVPLSKSVTGHLVAAQLTFLVEEEEEKEEGVFLGAVSWQRLKNFFCLAWTGFSHVAQWLPASVDTVFRNRTDLAGLKLAKSRVMNY